MRAAGSSVASARVFTPTALALAVAYAFGVAPPPAQAQPSGAVAVHGTVTLSQPTPQQLMVTTTNGTGTSHSVVNWQSFSIPRGTSTRIEQPSATSLSINRVVTPTPSELYGTLSSNGKVLLVNPAGITVGAGAVVDTAGFLASTLPMSEADAVAGRLRFEGAGAGLQVEGEVVAREGDVVLLAPQVTVAAGGVVRAPNGSVVLAAGQKAELTGRGLEGIQLQLQAPGDQALNLGSLSGDAVGIFAGTLRHSGLIQANAVTEEGGRVVLKAQASAEIGGTTRAARLNGLGGQVHATASDVTLTGSALVDASGAAGGGEILIGGGWQGQDARLTNAQTVTVNPGARLVADATERGNGGTVVVWADGLNRYGGDISARGGMAGGDGGRAEVSGKDSLVFRGNVDLSALLGERGMLLLDPVDITIDSPASGSPTGIGSPVGSDTSGGQYDWLAGEDTIGGSFTITGASLSTLLDANSVLLQASNNITVNEDITKTSAGAAKLTLDAFNGITLAGSIASTGGALDIDLKAGTGGISQTAGTLSGNHLHIVSTGNVNLAGNNAMTSLSASMANVDATLRYHNASDLTLDTSPTSGGTAIDFDNNTTSLHISSAGKLTVDGAVRSTALGGAAITLASVGDLVFTAGISSSFNATPAGSVQLTSTSGAVTGTSANAIVSAQSLSVSAAAGATLDQANDAGTLAASVSGGAFTYNHGGTGGLSIGQVNGAVGAVVTGVTVSGGQNFTLTTTNAVNLTQSQAIVVGGVTSVNNSTGSLTWSHAGNDFGTFGATTGTLTLQDSNALALNAINASGAVNLTAASAITHANGAITTSSGISLSGTGLGADADYLQVAPGTAVVGLTLTGTGGGAYVRQTSGQLSTTQYRLSTGSGSSETVKLAGDSVAFNGWDSLSGGYTDDYITLRALAAAGNVVVTTGLSQTARKFEFSAEGAAGAVQLGASAGAAIQLTTTDGVKLHTTSGTVTQGTALTLSGGNLILDAGGDVTLQQAGNSITKVEGTGAAAVQIVNVDGVGANGLTATGALTLSNTGSLDVAGAASGTNVALTGDTGLTLGANVTANGTLGLTATNAAINQTAGAITATGATTANAGTGAITLAQSGNDFASLGATGGAVSVTDSNALALNAVSATSLTVNTSAGNGAVTQTAAASVTAAVSVNAGTGAITLSNTGNSFGSFGATGGAVSVSESGALALDGISASSLTVNTSTGNGAVTQTAAATVTGATSVNAGTGAVTLTNSGNNLTGFGATGGAVSVTDSNALALDGISASSLTVNTSAGNGAVTQTAAASVTGVATVNAGTGAITLSNTGNSFGSFGATGGAVSVSESGALALDGISASSLTVNTSTGNGAVTQTAAATVTGATSVNAGTGAVTLTNSGNNLASFGATGSAVSVTDSNALALDGISASSLTVNTSAGNGAVTQTAAATVTGATTVNAGTGAITLTQAGNNFASFGATGGAVSVTDSNALALNAISATSLTVNTSAGNGAVTQTAAASVTGAVSVNAGTGAVTLTDAGNDFASFGGTGGAVSVADTNALGLDTLSASGNVVVSAGTSLTQASGVALSGQQIDLTAPSISLDGKVYPGGIGAAGGTLTLNGTVVMGSTSELQLDFNGSTYDKVDASSDGTTVQFLSGSQLFANAINQPPVGQYTVLTGDTLNTLPTLAGTVTSASLSLGSIVMNVGGVLPSQAAVNQVVQEFTPLFDQAVDDSGASGTPEPLLDPEVVAALAADDIVVDDVSCRPR